MKLDGKEITLKNGAKAEGKGSLVAIGTAGVTKTLTGDLLADAGTVTAVVSDVYTGNATAKWDRKPNEITKSAGTFRSQRLLPRATLVQKVQTAH